LTIRGASLRLKGQIDRPCVQVVLVYAIKTWAINFIDMKRLELAENTMLRFMCDVTLRNRKRTAKLLECFAWYGHWAIGHVERKEKSDLGIGMPGIKG